MPSTTQKTPTAREIKILALTAWGEARGEGLHGMAAVCHSIKNRVETDLHNDGKSDWWGEGYEGVCKAPYQFSCWNKNDPNYPYMIGQKTIKVAELALATQAAKAVISGEIPDPTGGATHYYATSMKTPPKWTAHGTRTQKIGNHIFYKDVK